MGTRLGYVVVLEQLELSWTVMVRREVNAVQAVDCWESVLLCGCAARSRYPERLA